MKKQFRNNKITPRRFTRMAPHAVTLGVRQAERLRDDGAYQQAVDILVALDKAHPGHVEVYRALSVVAMNAKDSDAMIRALEGLNRIDPSTADVNALTLWMVYGASTYMALAFQTLRNLKEPALRRLSPARRKKLSESAVVLERSQRGYLRGVGIPDDEAGMEIAIQMDTMRLRLDQGRREEALALLEKLRTENPRLPAVLHECARALMALGHFDEAIATALRVLEFAPEDVAILSNLSRLHFFQGRLDETRKYVERLVASRANALNRLRSVLTPLVYLGEDQACLDIYLKVYPAPDPKAPAGDSVERAELRPIAPFSGADTGEGGYKKTEALVHNLAAAVAWRLDDRDLALTLWKRAQALDPENALVAENLADLARPPAKQNGPIPLTDDNWFYPGLVKNISVWLTDLEKCDPMKFTVDEKSITLELLRKHPELEIVAPAMMDRANFELRCVALTVAACAETPALNEALKNFALGRRGTDTQRWYAAERMVELGLIAPGPVRLWRDGDWRDTILLGFLVTKEPLPVHPLPACVADILNAGKSAYEQKEYEEAEKQFSAAMALAPDSVDVRAPYAALLIRQNREGEADALLEELFGRDPDHFMGRICRAELSIRRKDYAAATAMLSPLMERRPMSAAEFDAFSRVQIDLAIATDNPALEAGWQEIRERIKPQDESGPELSPGWCLIRGEFPKT